MIAPQTQPPGAAASNKAAVNVYDELTACANSEEGPRTTGRQSPRIPSALSCHSSNTPPDHLAKHAAQRTAGAGKRVSHPHASSHSTGKLQTDGFGNSMSFIPCTCTHVYVVYVVVGLSRGHLKSKQCLLALVRLVDSAISLTVPVHQATIDACNTYVTQTAQSPAARAHTRGWAGPRTWRQARLLRAPVCNSTHSCSATCAPMRNLAKQHSGVWSKHGAHRLKRRGPCGD